MLSHNRSHPLGDMDMTKTRFLAGIAVLMMAATPVLAQTAQPAAPTAPARPATPATPAPAQPAAPAARPAAAPAAAATTPQAQRVNLNTASQADLDKLPQIGEARAKAILAERAKGRFTNWDNFVQRMNGTAVNQTAKDAIKDKVSF